MTDARPNEPTGDSHSRRRFLSALGAGTATAGVAALSGCASLTDGSPESVSFHASELPALDDDPGPATWATYPVDITRYHRTDAQARTNDLLEALPAPLSPRHVPNGHVRQHLTDAAAAARTHLNEAVTAPTQRGSLDSLRRARADARFAAAGWAAIEDGLTVDALESDAGDVTDRARRARAEMAYVGADPAPAVVVHASREALLGDATSVSTEFTHGDGVRVLQVAEYAEGVERARASLADASMLEAQFRDTLADDAGSLAARIEDARTALADVLRSEIESAPSERDALTLADADIDLTIAQRVLHDLYRRGTDDDPAQSRDGPARGIVRGIEAYAALEGYRRVRDRVESGVRFEITEAADVTGHYDAVHETLRRAPRRSAAPGLARAALANAAATVEYRDERLAELDGEVYDHEVNDAVEAYVVQNAIARAVPDAVDVALDALQG